MLTSSTGIPQVSIRASVPAFTSNFKFSSNMRQHTPRWVLGDGQPGPSCGPDLIDLSFLSAACGGDLTLISG
jgi:hypothetical protein